MHHVSDIGDKLNTSTIYVKDFTSLFAFCLGKPSKKKSGQTWDIVPSSLPLTPPYSSWDAYETCFQMTKYPPIIDVIKEKQL